MTYALTLSPFAGTVLTGLGLSEASVTHDSLTQSLTVLSDPEAFQSLLEGRSETLEFVARRVHESTQTPDCPQPLRNANPLNSGPYLDRVVDALLVGGFRMAVKDGKSENLIGMLLDRDVELEAFEEACEAFSRQEMSALFSEALAVCFSTDTEETFGEHMALLAERCSDVGLKDPGLMVKFCALFDDPRLDEDTRAGFMQWVVISMSPDAVCIEAVAPILQRKRDFLLGAFSNGTDYLRLGTIARREMQLAFLNRAFERMREESSRYVRWEAFHEEYSQYGDEGRSLIRSFLIESLIKGGESRKGALEILLKDVLPNLEGDSALDFLERLTRASAADASLSSTLLREASYRVPLNVHFDRLEGADAEDRPADLSPLQKTQWMVERILRRTAFGSGSTTIVLGDLAFEMSPVFRSRDRLLAFAAVTDPAKPGETRLRLYYHSRSQGAWRLSPFVKGGSFVKGEHYTAVTQPTAPLIDYFDSQIPVEARSAQRDEWLQLFDVRTPYLGKDYRHQLEEEFDQAFQPYASPSLAPVIAMQPGEVFDCSKDPEPFPLESLSEFVYPDGFLPDFSQGPIAKKEIQHDLLGPCAEWTYGGSVLDGRSVEWKMVVDRLGRAWIQSVRFAEERINAYGCNNQFINAGVLQYKPIDYGQQVGRLPFQDRIRFDGTYNDISHAIARLRPIGEFIRNSGYSTDTESLPAVFASWSREEGNFQFPGGRTVKTEISHPIYKPLRAQFGIRVDGRILEASLVYAEGYRPSVRSEDGGRRFGVEAEGSDFRYSETHFGGAGGFERLLGRFLFCVRKSMGWDFSMTDGEHRRDMVEAMMKLAAKGPRFRDE